MMSNAVVKTVKTAAAPTTEIINPLRPLPKLHNKRGGSCNKSASSWPSVAKIECLLLFLVSVSGTSVRRGGQVDGDCSK